MKYDKSIVVIVVLCMMLFTGMFCYGQGNMPTKDSNCAFPNLQLPKDFVVFASTAYGGHPIDYQIDQSGHQGTQIDVVVNYTQKPVVLMLGAYEPTIWNISWSKKTQIIGVFTGGYYRQAIAGIEKKKNVLISINDNPGPCGLFSYEHESLNPFSRRSFDRPVELLYTARDGKVFIGEPPKSGDTILTSKDFPPESFYDKNALPAGVAGIKEALRKGLIRKAIVSDAEAWAEARAEAMASQPKKDIPPIADKVEQKKSMPLVDDEIITFSEGRVVKSIKAIDVSYVVLKQFTYPAGLWGDNSAYFIVPKGTPKPNGDPNGATVYDLNCPLNNCPSTQAHTTKIEKPAKPEKPEISNDYSTIGNQKRSKITQEYATSCKNIHNKLGGKFKLNEADSDKYPFVNDWGITGLGSVYLTSEKLTITDDHITWPGCSSATYKVTSAENNSWTLHVSEMNCRGKLKNSEDGYIAGLMLDPSGNELKIKIYIGKEGMQNKEELTWGEFYRLSSDEKRNFFGQIGEHPITMYLDVSKKGAIEGYYYYDKYKENIPVCGSLKGTKIALNVFDHKYKVLETFNGQYVDDKISGTWQGKSRSLNFNALREPFDDSYISCEEMQKYPEKVFLEAGIDLGSGSGSPIEVDYDCKGGLASLDFINKLYNLTETIRSEGPQHICSGSIVHAHWRYYHYDLLKAGFAPELHIKHTQEWEQNSDELVQNTSAYMKFWARQSLYNFELYNSLITEYDQVRPLLVHYYQDKFRVSNEKAELYTKYALMEFTGRAFGSYPHDTQIKESEIEKIIIRQDVTTDDLRNVLNGETQQDDLDRALRVALLYQKPQIYLELLFKKGAKINVGDESALFFSLRNQKNIEFLLKQGANVNYENGFGKTALYYAIGFNNHTVVQLLVDHNADVNHTYKSKKALDNTEGQDMPFYQSYCMLEHTKRTPLMHAAQHSDVAMIKLLIKNGSHLRTEDEQGFNAADYAFIGKKSDNIDYLKSLGLQRNKPE